ncbi:hypothetical protein Taro_021099 [Colocasia esculenta]|uniref:Uncharacterized protein n=1 Tax=Colocasia esculenta TaxID=4460 RepID=A0A843V4E4_COLES|nr:hypothetical protein [Colocasia esculenta]
MAMPEWLVATGLVTHRTRPSHSCRDGGGRAYNIDTTWIAIAFAFPGLRGEVDVVLGARRRWSFLREGPNGSAHLVELSYMFHMLPSPSWKYRYHVFRVVPGRIAPEPPSAEDATTIEVAILSRRPFQSRHDCDALEHRNVIASARASATLSRQGAYNIDTTWIAIAFAFPGLRGEVVVVLGARRRWSFLREGPNGSAHLVELSYMFHMLPSPSWKYRYHVFRVVPGRIAPEPPSAEDATTIEVVILSRRPFQSRHDRDALEHRNVIASARASATLSRQELSWLVWDAEDGLGVLPGTGQPVLFLTASLLVAPEPLGEVRLLNSGRVRVGRRRRGGETSQQWQGARRAEETGR